MRWQGAESAVAEIQAMGRKAAVFKADFDRVDEVLQLAENAIGFLGRVDCLINNAGITFNRPFGRVTLEQFDRLYHVNVRAQFFLTQRIAEEMLKHGGGAVVNVTSIHGVSGAPEHTVYAGSKGAIIAYTRTLGVELAHKGIRVNAIAPGCIPVENYAKVMGGYDPVATAEWAKNAIPVGPRGNAVGHRQARRVPLFRRRRVHRRPNDRRRRRHHVADVVDLRLPQRVVRPFRHRLPARRLKDLEAYIPT